MSLNNLIAKQFINNPVYVSLYEKHKHTSVIISDADFTNTINILKEKRKGMESITSICIKYGHRDVFNFLSYDNILRNIVTDYIINYV